MYSFLIQKKMKGLKYTPTPKRNVMDLTLDVEFTRKLRLIEMFSPEDQKTENEVDTFLIKT